MNILNFLVLWAMLMFMHYLGIRRERKRILKILTLEQKIRSIKSNESDNEIMKSSFNNKSEECAYLIELFGGK